MPETPAPSSLDRQRQRPTRRTRRQERESGPRKQRGCVGVLASLLYRALRRDGEVALVEPTPLGCFTGALTTSVRPFPSNEHAAIMGVWIIGGLDPLESARRL